MTDAFQERLMGNLDDLYRRASGLPDHAEIDTQAEVREILKGIIECLIAANTTA